MFTRSYRTLITALTLLILSGLALAACQAPPPESAPAPEMDTAGPLVVYSGRNENLVAPLLERYSEQTGIELEVRYGSTAEMAATILEEGANSPVDLFFGQDAGALSALARLDRCMPLPESVTGFVDPRFVSRDGKWIGTSGRARVLVYNAEEMGADELPASVFDLTDERWRGLVGWAPTNGSFQAFVTAMRLNAGEEVTRQWIEEMLANDVQPYPNNTTIVEATGRGEVIAGLVNHYYLYRFLAEDPDFPAVNFHFPAGDVGSMINVAGVCIVDTSDNPEGAVHLIEYLLSDEAQQYFADETNEYPLAHGDIAVDPGLKPLSEIDTPDFDLSDTEDLQGTLELLQETGALD